MTTEYSDILYRAAVDDGDDRHVARITLNRPEKRNALGSRTVAELVHALERARDDAQARVIVLTGAGRAFCSGGDLSQMSGTTPPGVIEVPPRSFVDLSLLLARLGKPTIAMVNGSAVAGGLGLMVACNLAIAVDSARFCTPEINVGLWPMMIMATIFRNVGRKAGMRLILTGDKIDADEALRIGLINEVVGAEALEPRTMALARSLAQKSPTAMRLGLEAFSHTEGLPLEASLSHLERQLAAVMATEDAREGLMAFMQKREPRFTGR